LNQSTASPLDAQGHQLNQVMATWVGQHLQHLYNKGEGTYRNYPGAWDGIWMDASAYWINRTQAPSDKVDVNNDLVVDGGILGQVTTKDVLSHFSPDGTVASIMKDPIVAPPDARVAYIRKIMIDKGASRVPIMDGQILVGMISETDVANAMRSIKKHSPQNRQDNNVELLIAMDIMRADVITARPEMTLKEAARIMVDNDIGALPVMDGHGHLVGMITRRDILQAF
jgi:CBS domain-containing protein